MQLIFDKWSVVVGIDWEPVDEGLVKRKIKENGKQSHVLVEHDHQHWLGFHEPVKGTVYAGAALIGLVVDTAIVYAQLNEDQAWVFFVKNGVPLPDHDVVLSVDEGRKRVMEWYASTRGDVKMLGDVTGSSHPFAQVIEELNDAVGSKQITKKHLARAQLRNPSSSTARLAVMTLLVAVVCAAYVGYNIHSARKDKESRDRNSALAAAQAALEQLQGRQSAESASRAQIEQFQKQVEEARARQTARVNPMQLWADISALRGRLGVSQYGFRADSFDCGAQGCRVAWTALSNEVLISNKLLLPNVEESYTTDSSAVSNFQFQPALQVEKMPQGPGGAASGAQLRFWLHSSFAQRYSGVSFEAMQPVSVAPPKGAQIAAVVVGEAGKWRANFGIGGLVKAPQFLQALTAWPVSVTSVKINGGNVAIEGEYVFVGG